MRTLPILSYVQSRPEKPPLIISSQAELGPSRAVKGSHIFVHAEFESYDCASKRDNIVRSLDVS